MVLSRFVVANGKSEEVRAAFRARPHLVDSAQLSASITPHLGALREAITLLRADSRGAAIKVLVGGAAFNGLPLLWRSVGADGWAPDAATAIAEVRRLTS